ncbi:MAG: phosphate ABC transporter permease PstA [Deltaproteobacteria bacterium]|nr:phosphate ABC transporter permease PstA [Deltaproteobacteria bacterium]
MILCCVGCTLIALVPLLLITTQLVQRGWEAFTPALFTALPRPVGESGGGMANAFVGSGLILLLAAGIGIPLGIGGGLFLAHTRSTRLAAWVRFAADLQSGTPSIVTGIFVYALCVTTLGHFSGLAGGIALGLIMIPLVLRTTEEMLRLVPREVREGAIALGIPYWRVMCSVVLRAARSGIVTGILLSLARIAGETAPLLFTTLGNPNWSFDPLQPLAALPLQIFTYAISPFAAWQRQAWAGALALIGFVLLLNLGTRICFRTSSSAGDKP